MKTKQQIIGRACAICGKPGGTGFVDPMTKIRFYAHSDCYAKARGRGWHATQPVSRDLPRDIDEPEPSKFEWQKGDLVFGGGGTGEPLLTPEDIDRMIKDNK